MAKVIALDGDALRFLIVFGYWEDMGVRVVLKNGAVNVIPGMVDRILELTELDQEKT